MWLQLGGNVETNLAIRVVILLAGLVSLGWFVLY